MTANPASDPSVPDRHVVLLGSTGSIGRQALEVLETMPAAKLTGIVAHSNWQTALEQCAAHAVPTLVLQSDEAARAALGAVASATGLPAGFKVLAGDGGTLELVHTAAAEAREAGLPLIVLNGIVGAAGLRATLATLEVGATLALANKESMVAGGPFVTAAARASGSRVIPVDSEHSALFQCLGDQGAAVDELLLTGSGGPFRLWGAERIAQATPEEALAHPNWSMGPKITIDSATLMNKGLEVIEAHQLFGVPYEQVTVLVNPQSVVHSMVRFRDGAILAHLGVPDMRTPIGYALGWPARPTLPMVKRLDLLAAEVSFARPDSERFPCLRLAIEAGKQAAMVEAEAGCMTGACVVPPKEAPGEGGGEPASTAPAPRPRTAAAPIVLNAANEVAVEAFLEREIGFLDIAMTVEKCLSWLGGEVVESLDEVFAVDAEARRFATESTASRRTGI
ncbi:MAG: 1-deoxy-D-xylulose-5-phosphate reductoisomerase [Thermoleophilia bacterium]|jgi:1-deoxy-D-xylulose-5-phosphate reductoisomerase|nr:1-deoxy-D-xylulose-5-phosphate reductoisomerase [Thermoleophilia bacterium]